MTRLETVESITVYAVKQLVALNLLILVARATLPLSATHLLRGRQQRSTRYCGLQYDADWPEVLTEGRSLFLSYQVMPNKALSVCSVRAHPRQGERTS